MNECFEPLGLSADQLTDSEFKGFTEDRVDSHSFSDTEAQTSASSAPVAAAHSKPSPTTDHEHAMEEKPKLFLDRDGDKIVKIRVLCGCGKSITLNCQYPNSSPVSTDPEPSMNAEIEQPEMSPTAEPALA